MASSRGPSSGPGSGLREGEVRREKDIPSTLRICFWAAEAGPPLPQRRDITALRPWSMAAVGTPVRGLCSLFSSAPRTRRPPGQLPEHCPAPFQ